MQPTGNSMPSSKDDSGTLGRAVGQASTGVHEAIDRASNVARPVVDRLASGAHQAVDKIAGAAGHAVDNLGMSAEQLKNAQVKAVEQCRGYVRDNPLISLGVAIGAGFLLSRILSSR